MGYLLLSGATGLVGRYLLRDLLRSGVHVAVLVRPGKGQSAADRVEGVMQRWERECGHALARPVVFAANLCQPRAGLSSDALSWIADHCEAMLHCAASMTFREDRHGEPHRTNVGGTESMLEMCRETGLTRLHFVSTAYVCGLRKGRILETEVDLGQQPGNVYETSKLKAEKLVRAVDWLDELTIYRPASVVGDSRNGYVSSFHGFYLPLQLAYIMAPRVAVRDMNERFLSVLGLRGDEGKNFVPVDWLSRAIVALYGRPTCHGRTYHLASPQPVPVSLMQTVIRDAIEKFHPQPQRGEGGGDLAEFEALFQQYMGIYESHWRDDPQFDLTNTQEAIPELPCPEMDYATLLRVAQFPVQSGFRAPIDIVESGCDVAACLASWTAAGAPSDAAGGERVNLQVNGSRGGQWQLWLSGGRLAAAMAGAADAAATVYLSAATFESLRNRRLTVQQSIDTGRLVLEGAPANAIIPVVEQLIAA